MNIRILIAVLFALVAISWTACSSDLSSPRDLLLSPTDFPTEQVTEVPKEPGVTNRNEPAVQVELRTPGFTILESLVLFQTEKLALALLAAVKQDQSALGVISTSVEGFEDNSGIMVERLDGEAASTVFFVEGRAMVKITVSGEMRAASIWEIARRARKKAEG